MILLLVLLLEIGGATPPAGLSPIAERVWQQAEQVQDRDPAEAARIYRGIWLVHGRIEALIARAHALARVGELDRALEELRDAGRYRDLRVARAELLLGADRHEEAVQILREMAAGWGADPEIAALRVRAESRVDPTLAAQQFDLWLALGQDPPHPTDQVVALAQILSDSWLQHGQHGEAHRVLARASAVRREVAEQLEQRVDEVELRAAAHRLSRVPKARLSPSAQERVRALVLDLEEDRVALATETMGAWPAEDLLHPEVLALRARAWAEAGRPQDAEAELRLAEQLDPFDPRWPGGAAELLEEHFAGRMDREAFQAYGRALRLRPDEPEWRLRRARLGARLGEHEVVRQDLAWLERSQPSESVSRLRRDLERRRVEPPALVEGAACPAEVPEPACERFYLAYALSRRDRSSSDPARLPDDRSRAIALLDEVRTQAPTWVRPINLQASLVLASDGEASRESAMALLESSLRAQPDQPDIHVFLGRLHLAGGDRSSALSAWERAISSGGSGGEVAYLYLAEEAWNRWDILEARAHLDAYRSASLPFANAAYRDRADALEARITGLWSGALVAGVFGLGGLGSAVLWAGLRWRRRRRISHLLDRDPSVWRELASLASSIRHEVLRHHLGALGPVAEALERGDDGPARWLAERLDAPDGPLVRARERLESVRALAASRGLHVDLGRDPTFAGLTRLIDGLDVLRPSLRQGRVEAAWRLHALALLLEDEVDPALTALVRDAGRIQLDCNLIQRAIVAVESEPTATWSGAVSFGVEPVPDQLFVRAFHEDLHEVLCNLLRNAGSASSEAGADRVSIRVELEEDPITALEEVAIRVADLAPSSLSSESAQQAALERGLGLTVDRLNRCGGSLRVEPEPGFEKAVVARLPRVEPTPKEAS